MNKMSVFGADHTLEVEDVTCPGLDGAGGLTLPTRVDRHDAQPVVGVGLQLHHGAGGAAHHRLREEAAVQ